MEVESGYIEEVDSYLLQSLLFPSKIGGKPAWLSQSEIPNVDELKCCNCGKILRFLLQVYAPRDDKEDCFHRTIYLFCCKTDECFKPNSNLPFKIFRNQIPRCNQFFNYHPLPEGTSATDVSSMMTALRNKWGCLCDICGYPASMKCSGCNCIPYCSIDHQMIDWHQGHKYECIDLNQAATEVYLNRQKKDSFNFPEFELMTEPEDHIKASQNALSLNERNEIGNICAKTELDTPEKDESLIYMDEIGSYPADKQFEKFKSASGMDMLQVMRYSYKGQPIWVSKENIPSKSDIPRCQCGAERIFEFQVLPQLLLHLKVKSTQTSMDWGTLAVYTCADSCSTQNRYVREFIWKQDFDDH